MRKVGILGDPIKHSLSPDMHNFWLKKLKINSKYILIKTPKKNLKKDIEKLIKSKFIGVNLTIPLKEEALKYLNKKDKIVNIIGATNVLIFSEKGKITGKNTDVYGFKKSLQKIIRNKKTAIIIGSGGASRAVLYSLIQMGFKKIIIFNRTIKNSKKMVNEIYKKMNKKKVKFIFKDLKKINNYLKEADILINTTPMGMKKFKKLNIDLNYLNKTAVVYDLIYNPLETALIRKAKELNIKNINGIKMLIYQAEKAFFYWFGKKPKEDNVQKILENKIK
tara:strand:+ start:222 stop:1055 length:834 start_codon:yes stop_codon:yes gene_type:complete